MVGFYKFLRRNMPSVFAPGSLDLVDLRDLNKTLLLDLCVLHAGDF